MKGVNLKRKAFFLLCADEILMGIYEDENVAEECAKFYEKNGNFNSIEIIREKVLTDMREALL